MTDPKEEKTWNPDPDRLLPDPPVCFRQAIDYWSTKFVFIDRLIFVIRFYLDFFHIFNVRPV